MKYKLTKEALKEATWSLTDPEVDPKTGGITHTVKYKPDFQKAFTSFKDARDTLNNVSRKRELDGDEKIDDIAERLSKIFNEFRTHMRKNYSDEYAKVNEEQIELLVRNKLKEISATGTGANFNPGEGGQYATPYAFKKKNETKDNFPKLGWKLVNKEKLAKKAKGIDVVNIW